MSVCRLAGARVLHANVSLFLRQRGEVKDTPTISLHFLRLFDIRQPHKLCNIIQSRSEYLLTVGVARVII